MIALNFKNKAKVMKIKYISALLLIICYTHSSAEVILFSQIMGQERCADVSREQDKQYHANRDKFAKQILPLLSRLNISADDLKRNSKWYFQEPQFIFQERNNCQAYLDKNAEFLLTLSQIRSENEMTQQWLNEIIVQQSIKILNELYPYYNPYFKRDNLTQIIQNHIPQDNPNYPHLLELFKNR